MLSESFPWIDPLVAAQNLAASRETCWALLYSGQRLLHSGRYSYLCLHPRETMSAQDFSALAAKLSDDRPAFANAWFGMLGYELLHDCENLPREARHYIQWPENWFVRFGVILQFDHESSIVTCHREDITPAPVWLLADPPAPASRPAIVSLTSPMSRARYLQAVEETIEAITRGDFYQANITRKFTGEFAATADAFGVFRQLCAASPAAYSAFLRNGEQSVLSSSPERFLTISASGHMETRPIKGTAPRLAEADAAQRAKLAASEKDRAENLMIVDLMRNDLARACEQGSVKVDKLFEVTSYATLHHLASTISGQKREDVSTIDAVKYCFPPGSMTGAPKIRAMKWCLQQEQIQRGVYSGALGWFGGDGSCDLSVVIRTLVLEGNRFEFQVGGGIVADSDPQAEWRETMTKARGILAALGVDAAHLEAL